MPVTVCNAMYLSAVMKVPFSRGSCTSRSHPHFSHASGIHWSGSGLVVMPASSQLAAAYPFGVPVRYLGWFASRGRIFAVSSCYRVYTAPYAAELPLRAGVDRPVRLVALLPLTAA